MNEFFEPPDLFDLVTAANQRSNAKQSKKDQANLLQKQNQILSELRKLNAAKEIPRNRVCPWCGGELAEGFVKCKSCSSPVSWVAGWPCAPGQEEQVRQALAVASAQQQALEAEERARQQAAAATQRIRLAEQRKEMQDQKAAQHVHWYMLWFIAIAILIGVLVAGRIIQSP